MRRLTILVDFPPHFFEFPFLNFWGVGVEAADLMGLFVGEDGIGEGFVLFFWHGLFFDRGEWWKVEGVRGGGGYLE